MLITYTRQNSTFSNPAAACPSPTHSHSHCHHPKDAWPGCKPQEDHSVRTAAPCYPKGKSAHQEVPSELSALSLAEHKTMLLLYPDCPVTDPEDDLQRLIRNDNKLRRCGYYYGSLSWADASLMLRRCQVGTYLVRDSEHSNYLYALSVQTQKGPTSCRLDYYRGAFRLDSAESLADKMPRFDCVTDLVEHYVELTEYLSRKNSTNVMTPVWLDLDEENTRDAPVQIGKPLYKEVPSLQLMCAENIVRRLRKRYSASALFRTRVEADSEYRSLPTILKEYLNDYLFPSQ